MGAFVMYYRCDVFGIKWENQSEELPLNSSVWLSGHLVDAEPGCFEDKHFHDRIDEMDDEEAEEFWDDYQPSDAAADAEDEAWSVEITTRLEQKFGSKMLSFSHYEFKPSETSATGNEEDLPALTA